MSPAKRRGGMVPKVHVLIDSNVYLDLYESKDVRELLTTLPTIHGLFVSKQIVEEVARRRLGVTADAFKPALEGMRASLPIPDAALQEFPEDVTQEIRKFTDARQALKSRLASSIADTLRKVAEGSDPVSVVLTKLFKDAASPTEGELSRARLRRERGTPPGKTGNPLGDQLTWEQFLSRCTGADHIFVVSRDGDYIEKWNGDLFLNPVLRDDLRRVAPTAVVEVFNSLATATPTLRKVIGDDVAVPPPEKLEKAKKAEEEAATRATLNTATGVLKFDPSTLAALRSLSMPKIDASTLDALRSLSMPKIDASTLDALRSLSMPKIDASTLDALRSLSMPKIDASTLDALKIPTAPLDALKNATKSLDTLKAATAPLDALKKPKPDGSE